MSAFERSALWTVVELLLEGGARVGATNRAGDTPLGVAVRRGQDRVAEILRRHGAR